jgi:hypothetical protein
MMADQLIRIACVVVCAAGVAWTGMACDGSPKNPLTPQPTASPTPAPGNGVVKTLISGYVQDGAFRPLSGVTVQIVDGPQAGASTLTDADGEFSFHGTFTTGLTLRAAMDGYGTATQILNTTNGSGSSVFATFTLSSLAPAVHLESGNYDVTVVADGTCDQIPADLRTVSFPATVTSAPDRPPNTLFYVNVRETFPGPMGFGIGVNGNVLAFLIDGPAIVKTVPPSTYLEIEGGSTVTVPTLAPSSVSFPFDGLYDYCVLKSPMPSNQWTTCHILPADLIVKHVECVAKNHQLTLTRR